MNPIILLLVILVFFNSFMSGLGSIVGLIICYLLSNKEKREDVVTKLTTWSWSNMAK